MKDVIEKIKSTVSTKSMPRLSSLGAIFKGHFLAIDWDKNHVRLLEFSKDRAGHVKVLNSVFEAVPALVAVDDSQQFGQYLRELVDSNGISASSVIFMVGRERSFLHQLAIPASPETEVANLVRFQLAQELPFAIEESTVDYVITARNESNQVIGVLAAAVQTEYIDFLKSLAKASGLTIKRIGLRSFGNLQAAKAGGYLHDGLSLFVDISMHELEIDILSSEGGILFSRSAGLGNGEVATTPLKGPFLENALLQLKRTLYAQIYLAGAPDAKPKQILVAGSTGWEHEFLEMAAEELKMCGQVFHIGGERSLEGDEKKTVSEHDAAFVSAYGMACVQSGSKHSVFDFLSPKKAIDPQAVKARQIRLGVATLAAVLLLAFVYTQGQVKKKDETLKRLNSKNRKMKKELAVFEKFKSQVDQVEDWEKRRVCWLDEMKYLTEFLPSTDKAHLKHMFVSESTKGGYIAEINLEGYAISRQVIDQMAQELADTERYDVTPGQQVTMSRGGKYSENFKIALKVKKHRRPKTDDSTQADNKKSEVKDNEADETKVISEDKSEQSENTAVEAKS